MARRIPSGSEHLRKITIELSELTRSQTVARLNDQHATELEMLGTCLAAVYEAGACIRGCKGGAHVLERLCARSYNCGCSAYLLLERGFYDEALTMVRSIGEIANLVMLFAGEPGSMQQWLDSDKHSRLKDFSPFQVRMRLSRIKDALIPADEDWYAEMCENYTHAVPRMQPNMHNATRRSLAGGALQVEGLKKVLEQLNHQLGVVALTAITVFKFDDHNDDFFKLVAKLTTK